MTVYETTNLQQIRSWCEANDYWPGHVPGQPDRIRIGGSPFAEPEALELMDWEDWYEMFEQRQLKFVYDPNKAWFELASRIVRAD